MKSKFLQLSLTVLFALFSFSSLSQETGSLVGTVHDQSGQPVVGASISVQNQKAITSATGKFTFENIKGGRYVLLVSALGYEAMEEKVTVKAGIESNLDVVLRPLTNQLQTVEITGRRGKGFKADYSFVATKVAIPVTEIPSTVSTITQKLISERQAVRFDDVARNTNVRVTNNGRSTIIRGFVSNTRLINGLRTLGSSYRFPAISPVVESYEVVKGPSSSLFGSVSPGGVVNIVTKKPLPEKRQQVTFSTGSFNTLRGSLDFTGKVAQDSSFLYRINVFGQNSDTWYRNMKDDAIVVAPSFSFLPGAGTRINVDVTHSRLTTMENEGLFAFQGKSIDETPIGFSVLQRGDRNRTTTTSFNLSLNQKLNDHVDLNISYLKDFLTWDDKRHTAQSPSSNDAWSDGDSSVAVYYSEWEAEMHADNITGYFSSDFNSGVVAHKALLGYDYNISLMNYGTFRFAGSVGKVNVYDPAGSSTNLDGESYDLTTTTYDRVNKTKDYAYGVFFQDQLTLFDRLKVLLAMRRETYNYRLAYETPEQENVSQTAWLPKAGATYSFPFQTHLYASYITGFEPVASHTLAYGILEGGGDFEPEYSNQIEAGIKQELFNKNLLLTVALYRIKKTNVTQFLNPGAPVGERIFRQLGEVESEGFEVEFNGSITRSFSLSGAYNLNDSKIEKDLDPEKVGQRLGLAPKHQGSFWMKYEFAGHNFLNGFGAGLGASFSSKTPLLQAPDLTTPGYGVWDASLSYKINKVSINLNVNNLGNKRYYTGAVRDRERHYVGAPRNMILRLGYTL